MASKDYVPATPAGTLLYRLAAKAERKAWKKLLADTKRYGMPYKTVDDLKERGYRVECWTS